MICHPQYVGQIVKSFPRVGHQHRINSNKPGNRYDSDQMASSRHYAIFYAITNKSPIYDAHTVTFVDKHRFDSLDTFEDKCFNKLNAKIHIQSMILLRVK